MQRTNVFERYRTLDTYKDQCLKNKTSYFIENHESSTTITVARTEEELKATIVLIDQDGADSAYLYISKGSDFQVCDYFTWQTTTYFAYEQVQVVKDVDYIKYKILECNVLINDSIWAYFKSSLTTVKDIKLSNGAEQSNIVPLLICPKNDVLKIGGTISFNNQSWDIEDGDIFTLTGVGYYYLSRGLNARDDEEWEPEEEIPSNLYYVGAKIEIATENGYYKALKNYIAEDGYNVSEPYKVRLEKRNMNSVTILPLESGNLTVQTLKQGEVVETIFLIKENV